jgi:hypothetical protein
VSLFVRALGQILCFQFFLHRGDFSLLRRKVRAFRLAPVSSLETEIPAICGAIDSVCVWYPKRVLCLQRSAATTCLLKSLGIPAQLVVGAQQIPFRAHAWVEVEGRVVNDKPYVREIYAELDRC